MIEGQIYEQEKTPRFDYGLAQPPIFKGIICHIRTWTPDKLSVKKCF